MKECYFIQIFQHSWPLCQTWWLLEHVQGSCLGLILREYLTCSVCIPATGLTWTNWFAGSTGASWTQRLWGQDDDHDFIVFFSTSNSTWAFLIPTMFSWPTQCFSDMFFQGPPGPPGPPGPKVSWSRSGNLAWYWKKKKNMLMFVFHH